MNFNIERVRAGIHGDFDEWLAFNRTGAFESDANLSLVAPFPPQERMQITTGLTEPRDFASHGYDILSALRQASPQALTDFKEILDFGVGAGRLARMFKGFKGRYTGVDVDAKNVAWVSQALAHVNAVHTKPKKPLPFTDNSFDCVISISVFSHMSESDHLFYLSEIARVSKPGAVVMLTVHGERALLRGEAEDRVFRILAVSRRSLAKAHAALNQKGFYFIRQWLGHLNRFFYPYGITFISQNYIQHAWTNFFDLIEVCSGGIHDFQDIVVLRAR